MAIAEKAREILTGCLRQPEPEHRDKTIRIGAADGLHGRHDVHLPCVLRTNLARAKHRAASRMEK